MRILVTGSNGFIGRWVCRRLRDDGHEVFGLDRTVAPPDLGIALSYKCDILDAASLSATFVECRPHAVVHLAARVDLDEKSDLNGYAANIDGVRNLLAAIRAAGSVHRTIYTSSQLVCRIGYVPSRMDDYCPNTLYGESKVLTEKIVREQHAGGSEWCLVRPTTVWGPEMNDHYQRMLRLIRRGVYFHCGGRPLYKSYSYVKNIAHQYSRLLTAPSDIVHGKTFYLADYEPISLHKYADDLARAMSARRIPTLPIPVVRLLAFVGDIYGWATRTKTPFNSFRLKNIMTEYVYDLGPTRAACGDLPFSYNTGVAETVRWIQSKPLLK